ncbi:hypothetical protein, conserved [Babesia bigemina]|uniref:AP2/ERF domain-containing protein n=1 Tax=Babesia bigemina TaxID=5866 RepID=A0A061DCL9_BABBI|nr:hypothetical protein, conserved [Babesia bigemina]CDR97862.1 hypothetical protein, conserved [Babesia bigemina]|eukprot:XP_012770048.1 hypothetical protein, conserved [Babesia bigemina]
MYDPSGNYNSSYSPYGVSGNESFSHHAPTGVYSLGTSSMESNGSIGNLLKCIKTWQGNAEGSISSGGSVKDTYDNFGLLRADSLGVMSPAMAPCYSSPSALQPSFPVALGCHPAPRMRSNGHLGHAAPAVCDYPLQDQQQQVQMHVRPQLQLPEQSGEYDGSLDVRPVLCIDGSAQSQPFYSQNRHSSPVCVPEGHCSQGAHSETYSSHAQPQALATMQCQMSPHCVHRSPVALPSPGHVNSGSPFAEPIHPSRVGKRRAPLADHSVDARAIYHDVGDGSGSTVLVPCYPALETDAPVAKRAFVSNPSYMHPDYDQHHSSPLTKRPTYGLAMPRPVPGACRTDQMAHLYADADDIKSGPRLVYVGNVDVLGNDRIADGESNPFLDAGARVVPNAIITPRDILVYGRRGSFTYGDRPFSPDSDPRAASLLKNITVNCQYGRVRPAETAPPQPRVVLNGRSTGLLEADKYAIMATQVEKVRGVCYCRSDNSWTAWWTEKGRNRKKAFKVSRHGFYEARAMAIEHRRAIGKDGVYRPTVQPYDGTGEGAKRVATEPVVSEVTPEVSTSAATPTSVMSPVTLPAGVVTAVKRMNTTPRQNERTFQMAVTDVESPVVRNRPVDHSSTENADEFNQETAPTPTLDSCDSNAIKAFDGQNYCNTEVHTPVRTLKEHTGAAAWVPGKEGEKLDEMFKRRVMSACTTADSTEFVGAKTEELTPNMVSLHHDISDMLKLDEASVRNVKMAISSLAYGVEDSRLPAEPRANNA